MGSVLAVKRFKTSFIWRRAAAALARLRAGAALAVVILVAACGNEQMADPNGSFLRDASSVLLGSVRGGGKEPPRPLTRAALADIRAPLILITLEETGAAAPALPFATNGDAQTWLTANTIGFVIKDGVLFSSRGLGWDLLTAETDATQRAVRAGGMNRYARYMRYIGGDERLRVDRFFCEMHNDGPVDRVVLEVRHRTTQMRENCYALEGDVEFRNIYWIGNDGTIWDSRQWVSPQTGYVTIARLIR